MSELTATDIKVWDGSAWVTGFNVYDGINWQNVNDGKVNIRGGDGNWYRKGGTTSSIFADITQVYWLQNSVQNDWAATRSALSAQYLDQGIPYNYVFCSSFYTIDRLIIQFDLTGIIGNITSATINLIDNNSSTDTRLSSIYTYEVSKTTGFILDDYDNFGAEIGNGAIISKNCQITLNSSGLTHLNNYKGGLVSIILLGNFDTQDIAPTNSANDGNVMFIDSAELQIVS